MKAVLRRTLGPLACVAIAMSVSACQVAKSENPLSPTIAGPMEGVNFTPPKALQPSANRQIKDSEQPIEVIIENATSTSPRPFKMRMQIASDSNFSSVVWSRDGIDPAAGGQTKFVMTDRLQSGRQYYWRVMADDGANQSAWSDVVGFQVLLPAAFGAPVPRAPIANQAVTTNRPELSVSNGSAQGPVGQAFYLFQVSTSATFSSLVVNEEAVQQGGETKLTVPAPLANGTYYWRARISDGQTVGPWSATETFRTNVAAPTPGPSPGPGPAPGGSCVLATGEAILVCNRARYAGYMNADQIVAFLTQSAKDLNAARINGAPFGILVKTSGHQCNGYSCDILCSGNGPGQRQWDVLGDADGAQVPGFQENLGTKAIRPCIIQ